MPTWKKVVISGSGIAQLSNDANYLAQSGTGAILSGSFSGSFTGDGSGLTGVTAAGTLSSSAQIASDISGAFVAPSQSIASDISALQTFSSSLDNTFASEAELNASSSTLQSNIDGAISTANSELNASSSALTSAYTSADTTLSSSLAADIATNKANIDALGDTYATDAELNASSSTLQGNIDTVASDLSTASGSLASRITSNDTDIAGLNTYTSSLKTAITVSGQNVTVAGDLEVSGTTTTVDSTTVTFSDNIIALNGTGAANGGIEVNDANGPASGSLLWDGTNNQWIAGGQGSESKVLLASGDGILSGSAQIAADISGSFTSTSASLAADIATNKASIDALGDTYATDAELNASSSTLQTNIDGVQSNLDTASGSLAGRIATIEGDNATLTQLNASSSVLQGNIDTVSSDLDTASGSLASRLATIEVDNATQTELDAVSSSLAADIAALDADFATDAELNASSSTLQTNIDNASSSLAANIASNDTDISALQTFSSSVDTALSFNGADVTVAGDLTVSGTTTTINSTAVEIADKNILLASGAADSSAANGAGITIDGANESLTWDHANSRFDFSDDLNVQGNITVTGTVDGIDLQTLSGSAATRLTDLENFSSSLDNTFASEAELNASSSALTTAYTTADTTLSASLATDIAANASNLSNLTSGELNSGSFNVSLHSTSGSLSFTEGLEIGDVYDQGSGTTDIRVPNGASWLELNYADTDFIYLDGTNAGIQIDNGGGALEWTFYGGTGLLNAPGEIRIPAANVFSGSVSGPTVTATTINGTTINGTINADNGVVSASAQTVAHLAGTSIVSSSAQTIANLGGSNVVSASAEGDAQGQIKLNGVNVDINALGAGDSPTFNNLIVNGNFTTLGTVTNVNSTDLNVEDKFILLNSGSSTGNSGLIVQTSATVGQGSALFWDDATDRWSLDFSGADSTADTATADAYVAAVVTSDDANYQKVGNIRVDTGTGEAYIYTA